MILARDGGDGGWLLSRSICNQYSSIAERVSEVPANTEELVSLIEFLKKSSDVTVFRLRRQLKDAVERLEFLMDYADLPRKSAPHRTGRWVCTWCFPEGTGATPPLRVEIARAAPACVRSARHTGGGTLQREPGCHTERSNTWGCDRYLDACLGVLFLVFLE